MQFKLKVTFKVMLSFIATGLVVGCSPKKAQDDCGFVQNVYGERISWKGQVPIPLTLHSNLEPDEIRAVESAIKVWEEFAGRPLFYVAGTDFSGSEQAKMDGVNVISKLKTWDPAKPNEQGRTAMYWVSDQMKEADILLNASPKFSLYTEFPKSEPGKSDVHLESLLVHELGHVLGLKHNDETPGVMGTYLEAAQVRVALGEAERASLACEY